MDGLGHFVEDIDYFGCGDTLRVEMNYNFTASVI
jgi:hypothetical protein